MLSAQNSFALFIIASGAIAALLHCLTFLFSIYDFFTHFSCHCVIY
jgi:membrane associated rhomboid family serine protease